MNKRERLEKDDIIALIDCILLAATPWIVVIVYFLFNYY
jgi:hypothetical protein